MAVPANPRRDFSFISSDEFEHKWENLKLDDNSLIDLTGVPTKLYVYNRNTPVALQFSLDSLSLGLGFASFAFLVAQTAITGFFDYVIQNVTDPLVPIDLTHGVINFVDPNLIIPFDDIMQNEIPVGLTIPASFIATNSYKWRAILLSHPNADLVNATQNDPSTWPVIYNFLIAKLIVYDYLLIGLKGSTGGDGVKKIVTGPSEVDFFDPVSFLNAYGGKDAVSGLSMDICSIASSLRIYLLMCGPRSVPVVPQKQGLPCPPSLVTLLSKYY